MQENVNLSVLRKHLFNDDELIRMYQLWDKGESFTLSGFDESLMNAYWRYKNEGLSKAETARLLEMPVTTFTSKLQHIETSVDSIIKTFSDVKIKVNEALANESAVETPPPSPPVEFEITKEPSKEKVVSIEAENTSIPELTPEEEEAQEAARKRADAKHLAQTAQIVASLKDQQKSEPVTVTHGRVQLTRFDPDNYKATRARETFNIHIPIERILEATKNDLEAAKEEIGQLKEELDQVKKELESLRVHKEIADSSLEVIKKELDETNRLRALDKPALKLAVENERSASARAADLDRRNDELTVEILNLTRGFSHLNTEFVALSEKTRLDQEVGNRKNNEELKAELTKLNDKLDLAITISDKDKPNTASTNKENEVLRQEIGNLKAELESLNSKSEYRLKAVKYNLLAKLAKSKGNESIARYFCSIFNELNLKLSQV